MNTIYKYKSTIPYSLHDMRIYKIEIVKDRIHFYFENGYVELKEPYDQVDGNVIIEGVDFDFCSVHLLSNYGRYGDFQGMKVELSNFLETYDTYSFEVVDEMYGYNQVSYSGYLSVQGMEELREMSISIYYTGNIIYEVK